MWVSPLNKWNLVWYFVFNAQAKCTSPPNCHQFWKSHERRIVFNVFIKQPELVVECHFQIGQKGNYSEVSLTLINQLTLVCVHFHKVPLQRLQGQESARFIHQLYGRWQGLLMLNVVESKALLPLASHWERWRQKQWWQSIEFPRLMVMVDASI